MRKDGAAFDLPTAVGILAGLEQRHHLGAADAADNAALGNDPERTDAPALEAPKLTRTEALLAKVRPVASEELPDMAAEPAREPAREPGDET